MKRKIITIDNEKCNGCGECIPNCPEGAIQIIDGKARLISDLFCDGLGACLGYCPVEAISIEEREAEPYDERKVMENIIKQGSNVIKAHLEHLREHEEEKLLNDALKVLKEKSIELPFDEKTPSHHALLNAGCPGAKSMDFSGDDRDNGDETGKRASQLRQWPVQMHLISPLASNFHKKNLLLAADCVAYSLGDFHKDHLKGNQLAIACPKLDDGQDGYVQKITALVDQTEINTITVMFMEVPCCGGLLRIVQEGVKKASRKIPVKCKTVGIKGDILQEEWV